VANLPITIYHGMKIGQISFMQMSEPASTPYGAGELGSKYQGQRGPTPSRYWKNFVPVQDSPRVRRGEAPQAPGDDGE
jgi:dCTP deaminase